MRILLLSTVVLCAPFAVSAATLTGDDVNVAIKNLGTGSVEVGTGADLRLFGVSVDLDAGSDGSKFSWTTSKFESFGGYNVWSFSDLDFDDGSNLIGFIVAENAFDGLSIDVTSDSLTFSFDESSTFDKGVVLSGTFVTDSSVRQAPQPPASVPLPATAPLLLLGAAGMMALRRRKSRG